MKLLPCPFCGEMPLKPIIFYGAKENEEWWEIHCRTGFHVVGKCGAMQSGKTKQKAIKAWNTRHEESDV